MRSDDTHAPVFAALAHPARRTLIDLLVETPGARLVDLVERFDFSRIAVMKHLRVLEEAGLVISRRDGRERHHFFNAVPLQRICDRWTDRYSAFWGGRMSDIKDRVESKRKVKRA